jgi:four helix bundle protein
MSKTPRDIRERAFEFALRIIKLCQHLDRKPGVPRSLGYQLLKAGTSVGANIEEAQSWSEQTGFHQQELYHPERGTIMPLLVETSYRR